MDSTTNRMLSSIFINLQLSCNLKVMDSHKKNAYNTACPSTDLEAGDNIRCQNNDDDHGRGKPTTSGVIMSLALALAITRFFGWLAGHSTLIMAFSVITYYTFTLLTNSYRTANPTSGKQNYTDMDSIQRTLLEKKLKLCRVAQYVKLMGVFVPNQLRYRDDQDILQRNCSD